MRIIITGGLGFIGGSFIKFLNSLNTETDIHIINIDKVTYAANQELIREFNQLKNYEFKRLDIINQNEIRNIIKSFEPNLIIHFAAESHVDNSIDSSRIFIDTNILGTYSLLESTREYLNQKGGGDKNFKFIQISTDEVFGSLQKDSISVDENSPYRPNSPYSASKSSADFLARAWFKTFGVPTITTYSSNNFGPYQNKEKLIPTIIRNYINNKKIPIYGDGKNIRDWIYVEDNVRAIYEIAIKGIPGQSYNIAGKNEISNLNLARLICTTIKGIYPHKDFKDIGESIELVEDRPGHDFRYSLNTEKIEKLINWKPSSDFQISLSETIRWYAESVI